MTAASRRATAYSMFNLAYGVAWFAGSALMGWLYAHSIEALIAFSLTAQLLAIPCFLSAKRLSPHARVM